MMSVHLRARAPDVFAASVSGRVIRCKGVTKLSENKLLNRRSAPDTVLEDCEESKLLTSAIDRPTDRPSQRAVTFRIRCLMAEGRQNWKVKDH